MVDAPDIYQGQNPEQKPQSPNSGRQIDFHVFADWTTPAITQIQLTFGLAEAGSVGN
jgi:hypothetical protein